MAKDGLTKDDVIQKVFEAASDILDLERDSHPGLFTWQNAHQAARKEFVRWLDEYKRTD